MLKCDAEQGMAHLMTDRPSLQYAGADTLDLPPEYAGNPSIQATSLDIHADAESAASGSSPYDTTRAPQPSPLGRENWTMLGDSPQSAEPHETHEPGYAGRHTFTEGGLEYDYDERGHYEGVAKQRQICGKAFAAYQQEEEAGAAQVRFIPTANSQGSAVTVKLTEVSLLAATAVVPSTMKPGKWIVSLHNGYGGNDAWGRFPMQLTVEPKPAPWKTTKFNGNELGMEEALKRAEKNGGGIITFGVGRYTFSNTVTVPPNTVIKGAGMNRTSIIFDYKGSTTPLRT